MSEKNIMNGLMAFSLLAVTLFVGFLLIFTKHPDTEGVDEYGTTHLMRAVQENEFTAVRQLMEAGADVNARNKAGWTPLMYAAHNANIPILHLLLQSGSRVNNPQDSATSPLHLAIHSEKEFVYRLMAIEALLEYGADVGFLDEEKETPMMASTRRSPAEMTEIVRALQKRGGDINGISKGYTPLSFAIYIAEDDDTASETALALMDAGADPNISTGITALMAAVMKDFPKTGRLLLEKGADKGTVNTDSATALDIAVLYEKKEFIKILTDQ